MDDRETTIPSIDPAELAGVTGGSTISPRRPSKEQVRRLMLQARSSIKDLAAGKYTNDSSITRLMPFIIGRR